MRMRTENQPDYLNNNKTFSLDIWAFEYILIPNVILANFWEFEVKTYEKLWHFSNLAREIESFHFLREISKELSKFLL